MLKLAEETRPDWLAEALADLDEVLLDHAHCEKKAAGGALRLLFSYPQVRALQEPLAALAREELLHFQQVLKLMDARGIPFERQRPSRYAGKLHSSVRAKEPERLVDLLLVCALIEARSCERLRLLSEAPVEADLASFYRALYVAEARHQEVYVELARGIADPADVDARLEELAKHEAAVLRESAPDTRLHS